MTTIVRCGGVVQIYDAILKVKFSVFRRGARAAATRRKSGPIE
jgi:hypothetical protein